MLGYLLTTNDPEAAAYVEASRELEQHREEIREASSRRLVIFMVQRESGQCVCVPLLAAGPPAVKVRFFRRNRLPSQAACKSSSAEVSNSDTSRYAARLDLRPFSGWHAVWQQ